MVRLTGPHGADQAVMLLPREEIVREVLADRGDFEKRAWACHARIAHEVGKRLVKVARLAKRAGWTRKTVSELSDLGGVTLEDTMRWLCRPRDGLFVSSTGGCYLVGASTERGQGLEVLCPDLPALKFIGVTVESLGGKLHSLDGKSVRVGVRGELGHLHISDPPSSTAELDPVSRYGSGQGTGCTSPHPGGTSEGDPPHLAVAHARAHPADPTSVPKTRRPRSKARSRPGASALRPTRE